MSKKTMLLMILSIFGLSLGLFFLARHQLNKTDDSRLYPYASSWGEFYENYEKKHGPSTAVDLTGKNLNAELTFDFGLTVPSGGTVSFDGTSTVDLSLTETAELLAIAASYKVSDGDYSQDYPNDVLKIYNDIPSKTEYSYSDTHIPEFFGMVSDGSKPEWTAVQMEDEGYVKSLLSMFPEDFKSSKLFRYIQSAEWDTRNFEKDGYYIMQVTGKFSEFCKALKGEDFTAEVIHPDNADLIAEIKMSDTYGFIEAQFVIKNIDTEILTLPAKVNMVSGKITRSDLEKDEITPPWLEEKIFMEYKPDEEKITELKHNYPKTSGSLTLSDGSEVKINNASADGLMFADTEDGSVSMALIENEWEYYIDCSDTGIPVTDDGLETIGYLLSEKLSTELFPNFSADDVHFYTAYDHPCIIYAEKTNNPYGLDVCVFQDIGHGTYVMYLISAYPSKDMEFPSPLSLAVRFCLKPQDYQQSTE